MIGEIVLFVGTTGAGFLLGIIIANMNTRAKQRMKRERRQRIIDFHRSVTDEICRWDAEHPQLQLMPPAKGKIIFKGDADKMSFDEFTQALQKGFKVAVDSANQTLKGLSNLLRKSC